MYRLVIAFGLLAAVSAIPVDNGVVGDPEVECGPASIQVTFSTQNTFSGHVYVKNRFAEDGCRLTGDDTRSVGHIELDFGTCGVTRERSAEPKGIFVRSTIVISFHPHFLTKIDRAYTIQCFYMEADKTVSADIEVSMITTGFQTQLVPMPVCRYEILDSDANGDPVQFALIGQPVFHKWTCDTDTIDTFCMIVHSCTVDDGQGDTLQLIDEDGCGIDRYLIGNLDYPSDLMASKEAHVFKYADRPALFFNCQITVTVKEPGGQCERPQCAEPGGLGDGSSRRRKRSTDAAAVVDTSAGFETLDISPEAQRDLPGWLAHRQRALEPLYVRPVLNATQSGICMSTAGFAGFIVIAVALVAAAVTVTSCMLMRNKH